MFERFFLSADLGDGGAGDVGGAVDAEPTGAVGADGGAAGQQAQPFDYEGFAKQYGGPEGLQRAVQFASDIRNRAHYNPQFKEHLERALRGDFGPQQQQQAQQQQAAQGGQQQPQQAQSQGYLKYEPATRAQMETFHRLLQQAKDSGDPDAVQRVWDDPVNAQAREAFQKHQNEMNNAWYDQRGHFTKLWNDPEMQQMRQQEYQQMVQEAVAPIQKEFHDYQKMNFYHQHQKDIDALPQHIRDAFERGVFGPYETGQEWIKAATLAMAEAKKFAVQPQPDAAAAPAEPKEQPRSGYRSAANGVQRTEQPQESRNGVYKKFADDMRKARQAEKS